MNKRNIILLIEDSEDDYLKVKQYLEAEQLFTVIPEDFSLMSAAFDPKCQSVDMWFFLLELLKKYENELCLIVCDIRIHQLNTGIDIIGWIRNDEESRMSNPLINKLIPIIAYSQYDNITGAAYLNKATFFLQKSNDKNHFEYLLATVKRQVDIFNSTLEVINEAFWPAGLRKRIIELMSSQKKQAFLMTSFSEKFDQLVDTVKGIFESFGIDCHVASSPGGQFDDSLFRNIQVFMLGCDFGVGLYTDDSEIGKNERIRINPNLSLEVGYMLALQKPVCILKDKDLDSMNVDLIDRLYCEFDKNDVDSLKRIIHSWLKNKGYLPNYKEE